MIGLDTNVLVRYLTQDDPIQSARAVELIEQRLSAEEPGFIAAVVLAELAWVLDRSYDLDPGDVAAVVEQLLAADHFEVEHAAAAFVAAEAVRELNVGFADALIAEIGLSSGCVHTLTFDMKAMRLPGFAPA